MNIVTKKILIYKSETGFLLSGDCVHTTLCVLHMDAEKCIAKRLDGKYTAILKQHPMKQQLYSHLPCISKTIKKAEPDTNGGAKTKLLVSFFYRLLHKDASALIDQQKLMYIRSVRIQDAVWKTY